MTPCAWCGIPHRYGSTDRQHAYNPTGCINSLRFERERLQAERDGAVELLCRVHENGAHPTRNFDEDGVVIPGCPACDVHEEIGAFLASVVEQPH